MNEILCFYFRTFTRRTDEAQFRKYSFQNDHGIANNKYAHLTNSANTIGRTKEHTNTTKYNRIQSIH